MPIMRFRRSAENVGETAVVHDLQVVKAAWVHAVTITVHAGAATAVALALRADPGAEATGPEDAVNDLRCSTANPHPRCRI